LSPLTVNRSEQGCSGKRVTKPMQS